MPTIIVHAHSKSTAIQVPTCLFKCKKFNIIIMPAKAAYKAKTLTNS